MRKLLDGAATEDIESAVVQLLEGLDALAPAERDQVRDDVELFLELRGVVDNFRRRTSELQALYETAGDLSSMRDVEGVLQAIVRRGRQLLRTDVAYLMMVDEARGDTFMRVTEGTTSSEFRAIRLPLGVGLGGRVAETLTPHWTANYLDDQRYLHVIDDIVLDESLSAILGVPLRIGRRLLGVLFAADRQSRDFSSAEISLLASLADHAAIAIDSAALFQDAQDALQRASAATAIIESSNENLRKAIELHERLMQIVVQGGELSGLALVLHDVLKGEVTIWSDTGELIASAGAQQSPAWLGRRMQTSVTSPPDIGHASYQMEGPDWRGVMTPVVAAADLLGYLAFRREAISDNDLRSLERAAAVIAVLLLNQRAVDEADNRVRGEILGELLNASDIDEAGLKRRARLLGIDLDQPQMVFVIAPTESDVSSALRAEAISLARDFGGLLGAYGDCLVLLLAVGNVADPVGLVRYRTRFSGSTIGAAGPTKDLRRVADLERRARRTVHVLLALDRKGEAASSEQLGIYGLVLSEAGPEQVRAFVDGLLYPVRQYDEEKKTSLQATMEAYFACEGNVAETARTMFIHPNTVYQRLERLDRLLGADWRAGETSLDVRLALRLSRLLKGQDGRAGV